MQKEALLGFLCIEAVVEVSLFEFVAVLSD